ncbi:phosphotransferase [Actinomarinicola tropica]|uniref:Phosphotransferase n=1 Tax=Actinomarinicola tropica TaxID=2789776 RepID=A0A5Q2RJ68_9ACTN|nr:phosphotransferase [Actinomarinicola tropica]
MAAAAERHLGAGTSVEGLRRLSGGASRELWSFRATSPDGSAHDLVLRRDPPGSTTPVDESRLLAAAAAAGVPVPAVRFVLDPDDHLGRGFVMDAVEGEALGRRIVRDDAYAGARQVLPAQCGEALARVHSIGLADSGLAARVGDDHPALRQLDDLHRVVDDLGAVRPVLEVAFRWLRTDPPPCDRQVVVHGDFRVGNLIVGPEGLRAVLDWELAHVGDPAEDVGWMCVRSWRFGGAGRAGGVGGLDDLLAGYRAAGGQIDVDAVHYWEVFGNLRWAVICLMQVGVHLSGVRRSVEQAAIGRRVAEVEHDLMELLA